MTSTSPPRRVAVVGSTASGKSAVAMAAAEAVGDVEIVSVDSMQVYRGMDIGTAKPSAAERANVRHHLVDLIDPSEEFTVAEFQRAYRDAIEDLGDRGRQALLVGGTGLYHRSVIDDLDIPGEWPDVRDRLLREADEVGAETLHARLRATDPAAADRIEPTNVRRVVRALEVCEGSGRAFSSFGPGLDTYPPSPVVQIGLRRDRSTLGDRIERRVHQMMRAGLVDEVRSIRDAGGFSRTAAQALGYKEVLGHLAGELSLDEATDLIVVRTRQFAVRQERWFRRDPRIRWVDVDDDPAEAAVAAVVAAFSSPQSRL